MSQHGHMRSFVGTALFTPHPPATSRIWNGILLVIVGFFFQFSKPNWKKFLAKNQTEQIRNEGKIGFRGFILHVN